jgi:predicted amidophosphoribosyltransferase
MGPARICVACAGKTLEVVLPGACPVCSQILDADGVCPNWLCDDPRRRIERIDAIAYLSGALRDKIHRYKYEGKTGWSLIFARLVVGWLEAHAADDPPDLIIANPTFTSPDHPDTGHTERIIESAAIEDVDER